MTSKEDLMQRARFAVRNKNWFCYINLALPMLWIDRQLLDDPALRGLLPDGWDLARNLGQLATPHIRRLSQMIVGCSEVIVTTPFRATYQVFVFEDNYYLTGDVVLPYE